MNIQTVGCISRILRYVLLAAGVLFVVTYLAIALFRMRYPYELEWMEGGCLHQVARILSGQKLYVRPTLEFVPFIYPPLYFYICATFSKIIGAGFTPLRLVSFISSIGCFGIIFLFVRKETASNFFGALAFCLFAATFRASSAFFDIARVDSLFLFFLMVALYLIRFHPSPGSYVLAGVFISLSFLTKQTALVAAVPLMLFSLLSDRRRWPFFIGTVVLLVAGSTIILDYIHQGWFRYYVFELPWRHGVNSQMYVRFWLGDIIAPLPIAFALSVFYILAQLLKGNKNDWLFYLLAAVGTVGLSYIARLNRGGYLNALMPAYAILSILFATAAHTILNYFQLLSVRTRRSMEMQVYLICIAQFLILIYNPLEQIPTQEDLQAGNEIVKTIQRIDGDVLVPDHGYLPAIAGKTRYADVSAIAEIIAMFGGEQDQVGDHFMQELRQALRAKKFGAVILGSPWFRAEVEQHYAVRGAAFDNMSVFWPVTGMKSRPQIIYEPKKTGAD